VTALFVDRFVRELGRPAHALTVDGMARLRSHRWPANVRELGNLIERVMVPGEDDAIDGAELAGLLPEPNPPRPDAAPEPVAGDLSLWEQEQLLVQALECAGQNRTQAARSLKISREQLRLRMKRYGLLPKA
jgi:two-component system, NtrC family, response regulator AtoC